MFLKRFGCGVLTAVLAASLVLTGCGKKMEENNPDTQQTQTTDAGAETTEGTGAQGTGESTQAQGESAPDEEQVLNMIFDTPGTLDVNAVSVAAEFQILSQVQEGLFRTFTDENGNDVLTNAGCESYEISDDGLTYTFKLRDYSWSDGVKVSAQHFADSILRLLSPDETFAYAMMGYDIKNGEAYNNGEVPAGEVGVKAIDETTLEITLERRTPYFLKKFASICFYPVRLDVIEAGSEQWATEYKEQVFCGPFVIDGWVKEHDMVLKKNPNYWDAENVHLETVNMIAVNEQSTQALLFEQKELDMVEGATDYVKSWEEDAAKGEIVEISSLAPYVNFIVFNQHTGGLSGLMNNAKIRLALSLAFNRQEYVDLIYERHQAAYGFIPYGMMVGDTEFRSAAEEPLKAVLAEYDTPEKIQALFQEGLAEEGKDTDLSKVRLVYLAYGSSVEDQATQEYFKQTWENTLGIQVEIKLEGDATIFITERKANNYDILKNGWIGDYTDPMTLIELWPTGSGYSSFMGATAAGSSIRSSRN